MIPINPRNNLHDDVMIDALEALAKLKEEPEEFFYDPDSRLRQTIASSYSRGIIDDKTLDEALESAALTQGENDLKYLQSPRRDMLPYAEFLPRPEFLAYAIEKHIFFGQEERFIPFIPGTTIDSFCRDYGQRDLIGKLKEELRQIGPSLPVEREKALLEQLEIEDLMHKDMRY